MNARPAGRRAALGPALLLAALALGGCVYLRLLELKRQLADFDRYFEVDQSDGLKIVFKEPVLLGGDLEFFNLLPEQRKKSGSAELWHFRWTKDYSVDGETAENFEVTADFIFSLGKLARVILPERIFAFMPKPSFLGMVKSFGQAKIDREKRTASAHFDEPSGAGPPLRRLSRDDLTAMLGAPMGKKETEAGPQWTYRYKGASPGQRSGHINIVFTLDPATRLVKRIQGVLFNSRLDIRFGG